MTPLKGITVVDLSKVFAGPLCTQYLGDLGADVIKVEPVRGGDDTRMWEPKVKGQSSPFLAFNRNKRSFAVDLKSEDGRAIVHALVKKADVVIQGFKGGTAEKLNVDYATLKALNDRLIYCEISGYGLEGPLAGDPGYDVMLQAFSGMLSTIGEPDRSPSRVSFSPVDLGTGMLGVSGILAALLERERTGKGMHVELALLDSAMAQMAFLSQNYWMTGKVPKALGSRHGSLAPYQAFSASDGELMIGAGNDAQWQRLCGILGLEGIAGDPRFATNSDRVARVDETAERVQNVISTKPVTHWLAALRDAAIPCAPIHTVDEALAHPQIAARGLVVRPDHPVLGEINQIGFPIRFDGEPRKTPNPPPLLGEHSATILSELGFSTDEIDGLAQRGVIRL
ncbi:MAG: CoA transferase [Hyphomicrobiaceae bacterium]|nr:CoA transferase [Hyphomicrobiaceae bacterium]